VSWRQPNPSWRRRAKVKREVINLMDIDKEEKKNILMDLEGL
jgi:hypothetical protein